MKATGISRFRNSLRKEVRAYPWNETIWRMAADIVLVNASLVSAFALWFLFYVVVLRVPDPEGLAERFTSFVTQYWLLWSFLALLVFQLNGFYPQTRGLRGIHKAAVVTRAVSLFIVLFIFADYFVYRDGLVPRGVAVLGWLMLLLTIGGTRLVKHKIQELYRVEHKPRPEKARHVLVLGGAGYLGSVLVRQLIARGFQVRVLDLFLYGEESLEELKTHPNCELVRGDVRDINAVVKSMQGCDAVIHLAAIVGDSACDEHKELAIEVNRAATRMLVDVARGCGARRFIYASSCSVYGTSHSILDESSALNPLSLYAQTKVDSENILLAAKTDDFAPTVLRMATLFGMSSRMRFDLVVNLFVARALSTRQINIVNGEQWRPFLHVQDAGRAFLACLEAPSSIVTGETFNAGSHLLNLQIHEVGEAVVRALPNVQLDRVQSGDRRNYRVSFEKIDRALAFEPEKTLEFGIEEISAAIRSGAIADFTTNQFNNQIAIRALARNTDGQPSPLRRLAALAREEIR
jgi:nucleoside-diphosphate-sugar epimerase